MCEDKDNAITGNHITNHHHRLQTSCGKVPVDYLLMISSWHYLRDDESIMIKANNCEKT